MKDERRNRRLRRSAATLVALGFVACGSPVELAEEPPDNQPEDPPIPANSPPTIAGIDDQTVIRNTLSPRTVEVALHIQDPDDDSFTVTVESNDASVVPATTLTCGLEPCLLRLTPSPQRTARVTVQVAVSDGRGGLAETSFVVDVVPWLVTNPSDSDPGSLRAAVLNADAGDVIGFDEGAIFAVPRTINLSSTIELDRDLTIEGTGAANLTISGSNAVRVFEVSTSSVVAMTGLTVANGRADNGGGILIGDGSVLTLRASTIANNRAQQSGGGTHNLGTLVVLEESSVSGNEAARGGGISSVHRLEIADGSRISDNSASNGGGGIASFGTMDITEASISGNTTPQTGGGGILNVGEATIAGSAVLDNTAIRGGGVYNLGKLLVVANTIVAGNHATGGSGQGGGGIYNGPNAELTVSGSMIGGSGTEDANTAAQSGGGIRNTGRLEIVNGAVIAGNTAVTGGGISNEHVFAPMAETVLDASTVAHNTARNGGGIHNSGRLLVRENSTIAGNSATGSQLFDFAGGGILNLGEATISGSVVGGTSPEDANSGLGGGGISNLGKLEVVDGTRVTGNQAAHAGGGIANQRFGGSDGEATIVASTVAHNTAQNGGGIFNQAGALRIRAVSHVDNNKAAVDGGGIYVSQSESEILIDGSSVVANEANRNGGGIYVQQGVVTVTGTSCLIVANTADANGNGVGRGGGIYNAGGNITAVPSGRVCFNRPDDFAP